MSELDDNAIAEQLRCTGSLMEQIGCVKVSEVLQLAAERLEQDSMRKRIGGRTSTATVSNDPFDNAMIASQQRRIEELERQNLELRQWVANDKHLQQLEQYVKDLEHHQHELRDMLRRLRDVMRHGLPHDVVLADVAKLLEDK